MQQLLRQTPAVLHILVTPIFHILLPARLLQVEVPACPPTEAVLRVIPAAEGGHPGAQVDGRACGAARVGA